MTADFRPAAYLIILLGTGLSMLVAFVPQYAIGHRLEMTVFFAGIVPYLAYGFLTEDLRGMPLLASGLALLGVSLAVKLPERYLGYDGYADGTIFWVPAAAALVVLPVAYLASARRAADTVD